MKKRSVVLTFIVAMLACCVNYGVAATSAGAKGKEVVIPNGYKLSYIKVGKVRKDLVKDYQAVSSDSKDQSAVFQRAINDVSNKGGGILYIPSGTYCFMGVYFKSNVHIRVDSKAVFKPYFEQGAGTRGVMLNMSSEGDDEQKRGEFIENVSIKSTDGKQFTVDYSFLNRLTKKASGKKGEKGAKGEKQRASVTKDGVRFMICRLVRNFEISDVKIYDNITTYCGIVFVPISDRTKGLTKEIVDSWQVSCPTNGVMTDCSMFNASSGYGLFQLHGAHNLHFENIYSLGGVTLRLETGAAGKYGGVFDVTARKVVSEKGLYALMLGPHTIVNGLVTVEDVLSIGSYCAVSAGDGFIDENGGSKGYFANGCKVSKIKAIYGTNAQIHYKSLNMLDSSLLKDLSWGYGVDGQRGYRGPSLTAVTSSATLYTITFEDITVEGFPLVSDKDGYIAPEDMPKKSKVAWSRKDQAEKDLKVKFPDLKPLKGNGADNNGTYQKK